MTMEFGFEIEVLLGHDNYALSGEHWEPIVTHNDPNIANEIFDILHAVGFFAMAGKTRLKKLVERGISPRTTDINGGLSGWVHGFLEGVKNRFEEHGFKVEINYSPEVIKFKVIK